MSVPVDEIPDLRGAARKRTPARRLMQLLWILVGAWVAVVASLYLLQRKMVFAAPPPQQIPVIANGEVIEIPAGEAFVSALWVPPSEAGPVVVHFHGNAEQLAGQVQLASLFGRRGIGYLAVEYPGYGLMASQAPSERALIDAGRRAVRYLTEQRGIATTRIVLQGRSLGSGVATALAAEGLGARLILLSPFSSLVDVAAGHYPYVPVRWLLRDRFDNQQRAAQVKVPTLIIHGDLDKVVPFALGQRLASSFKDAKLHTVVGAGHNDLLSRGGAEVLARMMAFALADADVATQ